MSDRVSSVDIRIEFNASGAPMNVPHNTKAQLCSGLADVVQIGDATAAVIDSSGQSESDHRVQKAGQALVPMPLSCCIRTGCDWFQVNNKAVATKSSTVQVPDAIQPLKQGVLETDNDFFFVDGEPVFRGR